MGLNLLSGLMVLVFLLTILIPTASADFQCSVIDESVSSCTGTVMFRMSGTDNAHAGTASGSSYDYAVCCSDGSNTLYSNQPCPPEPTDREIINLSSTDNAHARLPDTPPPAGSYDTEVCLSADYGEPWCSILNLGVASPCPGDLVCLASLSGTSNAHVGDCSAYDWKICCRTNLKPYIADIIPPSNLVPGMPVLRGEQIEFNSTPRDNDGDPIESVEYRVWYDNGNGRTNLGTVNPFGDPWNVTWNVLDDITGIDNNVTIWARTTAGGETGSWYYERFRVNNTPPDAWFVEPPANGTIVGRIFTVNWENNTYADYVDLQYVDESYYVDGGGWTNETGLYGNSFEINLISPEPANPLPQNYVDYCYRIKGYEDNSSITDEWSCLPESYPLPRQSSHFDKCTCVTIDPVEPTMTSISTRPRYTNGDTMNVDWTGADASGVKCYQLNYTIVNEQSSAIVHQWDEWDAVNDLTGANEVMIYDEDAGSCISVPCTTLESDVFDQNDISRGGGDNYTYYFRARPVDDVEYGCANVGDWAEVTNGSVIDNTPPQSMSYETWDLSDGVRIFPVVDPDHIVFVNSVVNISVIADPDDWDYSGVNRTWIEYELRSVTSGYPISSPTVAKTCNSDKCYTGLSWDREYNVTYRVSSADRAGNVNSSAWNSFMVLKPFGLLTTTSNIYLTLGKYKIIPITVSNRQDISESVSVNITNYPYSRFIDVTEGKLAPDNRSLLITLEPKETKTFHAMVYTSDIGDDYKIKVIANSTRAGFESKISDVLDIDVSVVFPPEFPGLSWASVAVLVVVATTLYFVLERKKS